MKIFTNLFFLELKSHYNNPYQVLLPLIFLVMMNFILGFIFSNTIKIDINTILYWSIFNIIISSIFISQNIFAEDYKNGLLELFMLNQEKLLTYIKVKVLSHILLFSIPALFIIFLILYLIGSDFPMLRLIFVLMVILPSINILNTIGAALALASNNGGLLVAIILLPFYIPLLIFCLGYINSFGFAGVQQGFLALMLAILSIAIVFGFRFIKLILVANYK